MITPFEENNGWLAVINFSWPLFTLYDGFIPNNLWAVRHFLTCWDGKVDLSIAAAVCVVAAKYTFLAFPCLLVIISIIDAIQEVLPDPATPVKTANVWV